MGTGRGQEIFNSQGIVIGRTYAIGEGRSGRSVGRSRISRRRIYLIYLIYLFYEKILE